MRLSAIVSVRSGDRVLLLQRHPFDRAHPDPRGEGLWCLPGGKVEAGETLQGCAERELLEESGITAPTFQQKHTSNNITLFEVCVEGAAPSVVLSPEHQAFMWWCVQAPLPRMAGPVTEGILKGYQGPP